MKITLLQTDIAWCNPQENIRRVEALMDGTDASDLFVLPEMWATGFVIDPVGVAEDEDKSVALQWMQQTAQQRGCALSGSLAIRVADGSYRNRHYFVTPESLYYYDKHHLFSHGHEDQAYTAGQDAVIVEWKGWRWLLLTCYDLRFPVFSRYGVAGEYDGIILVANWPERRQEAWNVLSRARAMENQCYVVAVNRVGDDPVTHYIGGSMVIDPIGRVMETIKTATSGTAVAEPDLAVLQSMRQRFRVLADRDNIV